MCGIVGFLEAPGRPAEELTSIASAAAETLRHRGPDDGGVWVDPVPAVALGNRRLAIMDLSPLGHQPMHSAGDRYVVVFNGELYNFRTLRSRLEQLGHRFHGRSDTEVFVAAILEWGPVGALERSNGMFALAIWDRAERRLHLGRDRMGEKPLYYGWCGHTFLFGSELKSMRVHPLFRADVDREALTLFFRHKYVPEPWSIYRGIKKLLPGTMVTVDPNRPATIPEPVPYWDARRIAEAAAANPFTGSLRDAVEDLAALLGDAVDRRMESDVPLGSLLSGGVDSSLITALMQNVARRPVRTFTVGFDDLAFNESTDAELVAKHLGTDHTSLTVTARDALATIPLLPVLYDEPFADSSQIPTHVVSKLARRHVTVALSGDGADELFGGYNRYFMVPMLSGWSGRLPAPARAAAASALGMLRPAGWERLVRAASPLLPDRLRHRTPGDKLQKLVDGLRADGPDELYLGLVSHWSSPGNVVLGASEPPSPMTDPSRRPRLADFRQQMMFLDATHYLPGDILAKVDRASMGAGLEVRVPYLDHRVVELAWSLPVPMKIRDGVGKQPLRHLLERFLPRELFDRPKTGFGVPIGAWLRGPLRGWAEDLLEGSRLREEGFLNPTPIRQAWAEHIGRRRNRQYHLWDVLMFESWLEAAREPAGIVV